MMFYCMKGHISCVLFILAALSFVKESTCDEKELYNSIFKNYNRNVRPRYNAKETVNVKVEFELNGLNGIDEINQVLSTVGFIVAIWDDDYLKWDPAHHGGIEHLVVPPTSVWLPDIGIINSVDTFYKDSYYKHFRTDIRHDGRVIWVFGGLFTTSCQLDITAYPFDTQECEIEIENWAYTKEGVELELIRTTINLDNFKPNGEWDLQTTWVELGEFEIDTHPGKPIPVVHFFMRLKRKWGYYGLNILTPTLFITFTAIVVFWLPPESGEKVSLGITVLLSFSVFQLVIAEHTPRTSDFTPVLSVFLAMVMGMSTTSVLAAIIVLYIFHKGSSFPVPKCLKVFAKYLARAMCMSAYSGLIDDNTNHSNKVRPVNDQEPILVEELDGDGKSSMKLAKPIPTAIDPMSEVVSHLEYYTKYIKETECSNNIREEWVCVSRVIDRLFFWVTLVAIIIASSLIFGNMNNETHLTDLSNFNFTDGHGIGNSVGSNTGSTSAVH